MLMGGGDWVRGGVPLAGGTRGAGHFVILRASGADDLQKEFYEGIGGITSVETLVFSSRKAASDPRVLCISSGAPTAYSWLAATSPTMCATGKARP